MGQRGKEELEASIHHGWPVVVNIVRGELNTTSPFIFLHCVVENAQVFLFEGILS